MEAIGILLWSAMCAAVGITIYHYEVVKKKYIKKK
jgi:hypothetical protein